MSFSFISDGLLLSMAFDGTRVLYMPRSALFDGSRDTSTGTNRKVTWSRPFSL